MIERYHTNGHHWHIIYWDTAQRGFFWQIACTHVDYQFCLRLNLAQMPSLLFPAPSTNIFDQKNTNLLNENQSSHSQSHNDTNLQLTMHQWSIECIEAVPLPFD